ncbi:MAG: CBS domain-containing protein [Pirellulaceae bacterium]
MISPIDRLKSLSVRNVMTHDVVTVSYSQTMPEAAAELRRRDVAWAPVVDEMGRCIGVLSATDFLKREQEADERECLDAGSSKVQEPSEQQPLSITVEDEERVSAYMSDSIQSVSAEVPVLMAARMMCAEHIHRLLVLDHDERPLGVVSTMDVVAALLNAIEESTM